MKQRRRSIAIGIDATRDSLRHPIDVARTCLKSGVSYICEFVGVRWRWPGGGLRSWQRRLAEGPVGALQGRHGALLVVLERPRQREKPPALTPRALDLSLVRSSRMDAVPGAVLPGAVPASAPMAPHWGRRWLLGQAQRVGIFIIDC